MNLNFLTGTAAELIKVYPLIHEARRRGDGVRVVMTGQSRENFLMQYRDFGLPDDLLVPLLENTQDLERASYALHWFWRAARISPAQFRARLKITPGEKNFVVVHGDTLSTLVSAWLARRAGLTVVHIEAGLRSPSLFNPFPEEISRRLVSRLAHFHMAPDARAEENLRRAHVRGAILNTGGNTLLDAVRLMEATPVASTKPFALTNLHRFENLNSKERWSQMIDTIEKAAQKSAVVFVAHPQARHKLAQDLDARTRLEKASVEIRERMPFSQFIGLLKSASYLISDGGSNQEECSYLGKPCLLLRDSTERQEGLDGCCLLSRFDQQKISTFLADPQAYSRPPQSPTASPSLKILEALALSRDVSI